ncbi:phage holin family protein [Nocardioides sp. BGMRC 2183]|nr:phage holin family protein [Nocardioides sp. BGMRC 2183]
MVPKHPTEEAHVSHDDRSRPDSRQGVSTGQLVSELSDEVSRLVRDELRLAQAEVTGKAKTAGLGVGMLGAAGITALYGIGVLLAAAILGLAVALDAWLAALIVGAAVLAVAAVLALVGKRSVSRGVPPVPSHAIASVREDADAVRNPSEHH